MGMRPITANPSQLMVEQLAASGITYVFYNSGSREAHFFDALHAHPGIHGILGLHEGSVTAMAGGYTQVKADPAVMVVHLGAGLAQCMGQLINVWTGSLPVVVISFAGDTGSFADKIGLDLSHNFGPSSISAPLTKANWTVIEPEGLPQALERAIRVAKTPPVGPVHLVIYDRLLGTQQVNTGILAGGIADVRAGAPDASDVEALSRALEAAERPLIYVGDGVWKSGAEAQVTALAEQCGAAVASTFQDLRGVPIKHRLHCGRFEPAVTALQPDLIMCIGVRHSGAGRPEDYTPFANAEQVVAIGPDVDNLTNIPGLSHAVLADERRTLELLLERLPRAAPPARSDARRTWAQTQAAALRASRLKAAQTVEAQPGRVRPWLLAQALDEALERLGGGLITIEQFALPLDALGGSQDAGKNVYIRPAGGSEGYGIGAAVGAKLAAPDRPVVGLVGDGSLFYADSGLWTTVQHSIPVLYVIPNNQSYGIVANYFGLADGAMKRTAEYAGVVLDGIDPVQIAAAFGVEGLHVQDESRLEEALRHGLQVVEREQRPFLLDVRLPLGLPHGGRAAAPFRLVRPEMAPISA
jgi:thiamine pyrophosphate-dependent acetolactate synthase large subunit-like protein